MDVGHKEKALFYAGWLVTLWSRMLACVNHIQALKNC